MKTHGILPIKMASVFCNFALQNRGAHRSEPSASVKPALWSRASTSLGRETRMTTASCDVNDDTKTRATRGTLS